MDNQDVQVQILLGTDTAPFECIMSLLINARNDSCVQAEHLINACKQKHPGTLLMRLVHILQHGSEDGLRSMAAVLLRKNIGLWPQLDNASQIKVKGQLLSCLVSEAVRSVWKVLCDTIAELAAYIFYEDGWPELLPFLFRCCESKDYTLKEKSLLVIGQVKPHATLDVHMHLDMIKRLICRSLSSSEPDQVHVAALRAFANFIQSLNSKEIILFQDLLPLMMQTLVSSLEAFNATFAQEKLETLIEVAGTAPEFLHGHFLEVLSFMIGIVEAQGLEDGVRHLALEFFLTLAEARGYACVWMRTLPELIARLFVFLLNLLEDIEDSASWLSADTKDVNAGLSNKFILGKEGLDRLSNSLGGKIMYPIAYSKVISCLNDSNWRKRHAALIALSQTAKGCHKVMIKQLESVIHMLLVSFGDPHTRVRWAAINAIGQFCMDFGSEVTERFHHKIVPVLIDAVGDFQNTHVQAQAAEAVVSFCGVCGADVLKRWLYELIEKLRLLLQSGKCMQQEIALAALAAVADSAQLAFRDYYDSLMPCLKHILYNAIDSRERVLRSKTMESIGVIGLAVGKDKFSQDAKEVMNVLMHLNTSISDDPTAGYLLQTTSRICKCIGEDFLPYMNAVMPPLLEILQLDHGVTVADANAMVEQLTDCHYDRETITVGNKRVVINMNRLEDKAIACDVLCCYLDELKEGFYPWLEKVLPVIASLITFPFHAVIRMAAVSAMPRLLFVGKSAIDKGLAPGHNATYIKELSDYVLSSLVKGLIEEQVTEVLIKILGSLEENIQLSWIPLEADLVQDIVEGLKDVIIASMSRTKERLELRASEDFDEEELEQLKDEDAEEGAIFMQVGKCIGVMAKLQRSTFAPYFNELVPFLTPMLEKDRTSEEKCVAICIFNDVAEHCGASAARYYGMFFPFLLEAAVDADADVRQAAAYGIGICAEHGDAQSELYIKEALRTLDPIISHQSAFQFENRMATDNAISALGKICEHRRDCISAAQVIPAWLHHLPIRNDLKEAKVLHQLFFSMVERLDALLLGRSNQNLPKILSVFAEIIMDGGDLASEEMLVAIPGLLQKLKKEIEPAAFTYAWALLPSDHQDVLYPILKQGDWYATAIA